jgi:hypothetical protein
MSSFDRMGRNGELMRRSADEAQRNRHMEDRVDRRDEERRQDQIRAQQNERCLEEERDRKARDRAEAERRERDLDEAFARQEERGKYQEDMSSASQRACWASKRKHRNYDGRY